MNYNVDFNSKIDMKKSEMNAEKAVEAAKEGKGFFMQVKEDSDGNKHFFNVYGPAPDKLDHICNIFIDSDSLGPIFRAAVQGKLKAPENKEEDDRFEGSQTTIDYTDEPIMWVLKNTKEKVYLDAYERDEKKGFRDPAIEKEWDKEDGSMQVTDERLKEDNYLFYLTVFVCLRNHLIAEGLVDELRKLNKYSGAGILVSAKDEDTITARIVQDKGRPDLPCEVFLMGRITCRPYLDELIAESRISDLSLEDRIKAANEGDQYAMEALAKSYLDGDEVNRDYKESFKWWKKLAEAGNATAQFNTGLYYAKGCGVPRDFAKAAEWMQKSADNGDTDAANAVEAYKKADENLRKAEAGDAASQAELAELYTQMGNSLAQLDADTDYKEAFKWAKSSADQGNLKGLYILGLCYEHGRGTAFDYEKSTKAYETAANMGHAPSQWNLACHYLRGFDDNEEKGLMLAYQAAEQGYELAVKGLEESGNTVEKLKEYYEDPERIITLESTQYEGRADRCERIHVGDELTYKIVRDKYGKNALELFYKGGSVGLAFQHSVGKIIALLKMNRANLKVTVRSCIPKSKRGPRARNADVTLNMILTEIKPETPEEKQARLEREEIEREARLKTEAEAKARAEEERKRKAEEEARRKEQERIQKEKEEQEKKALEKELASAQNATEHVRNMLCVESESGAIAIVTLEGKVYTSGLPDHLKKTVEAWTDIKQISMRISPDKNREYIVGLKWSGTVLFAGKMGDYKVDLSSWNNIKQIDCGWTEILGLTDNGTVLAVGDPEYGGLKVESWTNIKRVIGGIRHSIGLKKDGSVVECGEDSYRWGILKRPEKDNFDIAISGMRTASIFGLTKIGTVHVPYTDIYDVPKWTNIISISQGIDDECYIFGVTEDGKVKVAFSHGENPKYKEVLAWENIAYVAGGKNSVVAITKDGYIKSTSETVLPSSVSGIKLFDDYKDIANARKRVLEAAERKRIEELKARIESLETEMQNAKGLFAGSKKKRLQKEIDELKAKL